MAQQPTVVFELLSMSTAAIVQSRELRDHEAALSIAAYVLVDQDKPWVLVHARDRH